MARINLLNAILATLAIVAMGVIATPSSTLPVSSDALASAADLDDDGQPLRYINSVYGDEEDDDYSAAELESRAALRRTKHHHRHSKHRASLNRKLFSTGPAVTDTLWAPKVQITWYAAHDLLNPQCGNGGGDWQPENSSHIGAVVKHWTDGPQCGEFVRLCNKNANNHCVLVRVIDKCAGCGENHVDLTKSAFKRLSPSGTLTEGRIHGLQMYRSKQPNPWDLALFGPKLLAA